MTYECYVQKNFKPKTLALIDTANRIIEEYEADDYVLNLRQLFYVMVSKNIIENTLRSYKNLGQTISDGRLAGLVSWEALEDRTRHVEARPHWSGPAGVIQSAADSYGRDLWADQDRRVEVWGEKEALAGVMEPECRRLDVPYFSCRGYVSQSEMWRAAQRINDRWQVSPYQPTLIIHLGDHDPSGIDMTRDIFERLELMTDDGAFEVKRIALNRDQIDRYRPPPNPAKVTDSRSPGYIRQHGRKSWELDALDPRTLSALIRRNIEAAMDRERWQAIHDEQEAERSLLQDCSNSWDEIVDDYLRD